MIYLAKAIGMTAAKLTDPLTYAMLVAFTLVYKQKYSWVAYALVCLAFTAINIAIVFPWWKEIGIANRWETLSVDIFMSFVIVGILYIFIMKLFTLIYSNLFSSES